MVGYLVCDVEQDIYWKQEVEGLTKAGIVARCCRSFRVELNKVPAFSFVCAMKSMRLEEVTLLPNLSALRFKLALSLNFRIIFIPNPNHFRTEASFPI
jgi:hypothetical protein